MLRLLRSEQLITFALFMRDVLQLLVKVSLAAQRENSTVADVFKVLNSVSAMMLTFEAK